MIKNVIAILALWSILCQMTESTQARGQTPLEKKLDSLFIIASSGEVRFRDQNEPAMDSIAAYGKKAIPFLIDKFTTKSARERWTVIWTLQRIGSEAVPQLVAALRREDPLVVQRICWALGDIADTAATEALIDIGNHDWWQVRGQVVRALGKIGDPRGALTVENALADSIGQIRKQAVVAAGQLHLQRLRQKLIHLLGDSFYGARWMAANTILEFDSTETVAALADSIDSENDLVGDLACWILGEIGTDQAIQLLHEQTQSDDPDRRAHAGVALVEADPQDNCGFRTNLLEQESNRFVLLKIESAVAVAQHETREH
jgi:HEAT repeat protein